MIIHRDLKLENIMLSPEHHGKFGDRGVRAVSWWAQQQVHRTERAVDDCVTAALEMVAHLKQAN